MRLYDTARRDVVSFDAEEHVGIYVCGITPYDATHLGHAATYVTYDVVQRRLIDLGHTVRLVRNITDVDDDLLAAARRRGVHYLDLAHGEIKRFHDDLEALNVLPPWSEPRATGAIPDIRGIIAMVFDRGAAYLRDGTVYFDSTYAEGFGELSGLDRAAMLEVGPTRGERPDDPNKANPLDFVLWMPSARGEPEWESPWGRGRPGWHVECSALALRESGTTIDLHGGGSDLIYPHHECEQAQSKAATGEVFVRHWMHQAMVLCDGEKMAKSRGNLVFVADLFDQAPPAAVRLMIVSEHYRRSWTYTDALLSAACDRLATWSLAGRGSGALGAVRAALDNDLDCPAAVAAIDAAAAQGHGVSRGAALLGVELSDLSGGH